MDTVKSLEKQLLEVNKGLPKLPAGLTKWLADNGWLLVLIGIVFSITALVMVVPLMLIAFGISTTVGVGNMMSGYGFTPLIGSLAWLSTSLSFVNFLIIIVLEAKAVTPLKNKLIRGWQLIFIASLINLAFSVFTNIVTGSLSSLILGLIVYAFGFYVLAQLHPHFVPHAATKDKKPAFKAAK